MHSQQDERGWLDPRAAEGQLRGVLEAQKGSWLDLPPVPAFLGAMRHIRLDSGQRGSLTLLDVGCGVGMYYAVCKTHCPGVIYAGCDFSPHMIALAKKHFSEDVFFVADITGEALLGYDILLASALLEVCQDWRGVLDSLMVQNSAWLILNRVRVWHDPGQPTEHREYETPYGTTSWDVTHNWPQLAKAIWDNGGSIIHTRAYQVDAESTLMCYTIKLSR